MFKPDSSFSFESKFNAYPSKKKYDLCDNFSWCSRRVLVSTIVSVTMVQFYNGFFIWDYFDFYENADKYFFYSYL